VLRATGTIDYVLQKESKQLAAAPAAIIAIKSPDLPMPQQRWDAQAIMRPPWKFLVGFGLGARAPPASSLFTA
jgi:hypothetical protein